MSDETQTEKVEKDEEAPTTETVEPTQEPEAKTVDELQKELEAAKRSLQNKTDEAKRVHGKLTKFEKAEEERKRAELSEMEKLQADLSQAQADLKFATLTNLKRTVAEKTGLPAALFDRLKGETLEDLEADANALLEALPEAAKKKAPVLNTSNPGSTLPTDESDEERRRRLGI